MRLTSWFSVSANAPCPNFLRSGGNRNPPRRPMACHSSSSLA
jgi:hypothetical protein